MLTTHQSPAVTASPQGEAFPGGRLPPLHPRSHIPNVGAVTNRPQKRADRKNDLLLILSNHPKPHWNGGAAEDAGQQHQFRAQSAILADEPGENHCVQSAGHTSHQHCRGVYRFRQCHHRGKTLADAEHNGRHHQKPDPAEGHRQRSHRSPLASVWRWHKMRRL